MFALSMELFGAALPVADFPQLPGIRGLGISDSLDYAKLLHDKFSYSNTWYHREPRFDLTNLPDAECGRYDFVLCSEVLEHVAPPVDIAFRNLCRLLKPSGVAIITVPFSLDDATVEHFEDLHDWGLARLQDGFVLVNRVKDGGLEIHENLMFHGGPGSTLEVRLLSQRDLSQRILQGGFREVHFYGEDVSAWGIASAAWSLPFSARKERFSLPISCSADWLEQWGGLLDAMRSRQAEIFRLEKEVAVRTAWAKRLDGELESAAARITGLQNELESRTEWAQRIDAQLNERTEWALNLEKDVAHHVELAERMQKDNEELREKLEAASRELEELRHSRAVRMGKRLGLG